MPKNKKRPASHIDLNDYFKQDDAGNRDANVLEDRAVKSWISGVRDILTKDHKIPKNQAAMLADLIMIERVQNEGSKNIDSLRYSAHDKREAYVRDLLSQHSSDDIVIATENFMRVVAPNFERILEEIDESIRYQSLNVRDKAIALNVGTNEFSSEKIREFILFDLIKTTSNGYKRLNSDETDEILTNIRLAVETSVEGAIEKIDDRLWKELKPGQLLNKSQNAPTPLSFNENRAYSANNDLFAAALRRTGLANQIKNNADERTEDLNDIAKLHDRIARQPGKGDKPQLEKLHNQLTSHLMDANRDVETLNSLNIDNDPAITKQLQGAREKVMKNITQIQQLRGPAKVVTPPQSKPSSELPKPPSGPVIPNAAATASMRAMFNASHPKPASETKAVETPPPFLSSLKSAKPVVDAPEKIELKGASMGSRNAVSPAEPRIITIQSKPKQPTSAPAEEKNQVYVTQRSASHSDILATLTREAELVKNHFNSLLNQLQLPGADLAAIQKELEAGNTKFMSTSAQAQALPNMSALETRGAFENFNKLSEEIRGLGGDIAQRIKGFDVERVATANPLPKIETGEVTITPLEGKITPAAIISTAETKDRIQIAPEIAAVKSAPEPASPSTAQLAETAAPMIEAASTPAPVVDVQNIEIPGSQRFVPTKIEAFENRGRKNILPRIDSAAVVEAKLAAAARNLEEIKHRDDKKIQPGDIDIVIRQINTAMASGQAFPEHNQIAHHIKTLTEGVTTLEQKKMALAEASAAAAQATQMEPEIKIESGDASEMSRTYESTLNTENVIHTAASRHTDPAEPTIAAIIEPEIKIETGDVSHLSETHHVTLNTDNEVKTAEFSAEPHQSTLVSDPMDEHIETQIPNAEDSVQEDEKTILANMENAHAEAANYALLTPLDQQTKADADRLIEQTQDIKVALDNLRKTGDPGHIEILATRIAMLAEDVDNSLESLKAISTRPGAEVKADNQDSESEYDFFDASTGQDAIKENLYKVDQARAEIHRLVSKVKPDLSNLHVTVYQVKRISEGINSILVDVYDQADAIKTAMVADDAKADIDKASEDFFADIVDAQNSLLDHLENLSAELVSQSAAANAADDSKALASRTDDAKDSLDTVKHLSREPENMPLDRTKAIQNSLETAEKNIQKLNENNVSDENELSQNQDITNTDDIDVDLNESIAHDEDSRISSTYSNDSFEDSSSSEASVISGNYTDDEFEPEDNSIDDILKQVADKRAEIKGLINRADAIPENLKNLVQTIHKLKREAQTLLKDAAYADPDTSSKDTIKAMETGLISDLKHAENILLDKLLDASQNLKSNSVSLSSDKDDLLQNIDFVEEALRDIGLSTDPTTQDDRFFRIDQNLGAAKANANNQQTLHDNDQHENLFSSSEDSLDDEVDPESAISNDDEDNDLESVNSSRRPSVSLTDSTSEDNDDEELSVNSRSSENSDDEDEEKDAENENTTAKDIYADLTQTMIAIGQSASTMTVARTDSNAVKLRELVNKLMATHTLVIARQDKHANSQTKHLGLDIYRQKTQETVEKLTTTFGTVAADLQQASRADLTKDAALDLIQVIETNQDAILALKDLVTNNHPSYEPITAHEAVISEALAEARNKLTLANNATSADAASTQTNTNTNTNADTNRNTNTNTVANTNQNTNTNQTATTANHTEILRKLDNSPPPPNPYTGDMPTKQFMAIAERIIYNRDFQRVDTLIEYFNEKIKEARDPNATNLAMREKLITDWNQKIFPLLERVNTRIQDLENIQQSLGENSQTLKKDLEGALKNARRIYDKLYVDKGNVRATIQQQLDKFGLDAIKIDAHTAVTVSRQPGQTDTDFQKEIKKACDKLYQPDASDKPFTMGSEDFSYKIATEAAVVQVPGTFKDSEKSYLAKHFSELRDEKNSMSVYSVQSGNKLSTSQVSIHHLREDLKVENMLLRVAFKNGLADRLPNPDPKTAGARLHQLMSTYHERPFSQAGLQKFFEVQVRKGILELPKPITGLVRIGPTCRSMAAEIYGDYLKCVRDPKNPDVPAEKTLQLAFLMMRDFINANRGQGKIPVNNMQNPELNRAIQLVCEVMKRNVSSDAERFKFEYKTVGATNKEDFSRSFYQRNLIGAVQKSLLNIDKDFVAALSATHKIVLKAETRREVQTTVFKLATTENATRVPSQTADPTQTPTPTLRRK